MKKDSELYKKIRVHCYIVGLIAFLTALIVGAFLLHNLEKDEKTTGKYMAQITEKRVRLQGFGRTESLRTLYKRFCREDEMTAERSHHL